MRFVLLDLAGHARHRTHGLHRIVAHSRFVAQHHGIHALVNGTGHVAHLGPSRTGRAHHRIKHLRSDDHRSFGGYATLHDTPLRVGNRLGRKFDPQIAPGDHHPVRSLDDFVQVVDPLLVLDLGDDLDRTVVTVENLLHGTHVPGAPHEGVSDEIDVVLHGPFDEAAVFFRHRRQVDLHPRHIDALARPLAHQLLVGLVRHAEFQLPVGNQQPRTDRDIAYHRRHVEVDRIAGRRFAIGRPAHLHALPGLKADRTAVLVGHGRHTDFRSFGIQNDRNRRIDPAPPRRSSRPPLRSHAPN